MIGNAGNAFQPYVGGADLRIAGVECADEGLWRGVFVRGSDVAGHQAGAGV